jgi:uncharacterized protein (TIGR00730 family)
MRSLRRVAVFCGSSTGADHRHAELAAQLGRELAEAGIELVYGGGAVGLMGVLADACLEAGGTVVGVIPTGLFSREVGHTGLTELVEVPSMHERKQRMYDLADGFVALPGGLGTLEELAEVLTWNQLGIMAKPVVLLDAGGFWQGLVDWLDGAAKAGFVRDAHRRSLVVTDDVAVVLELLRATEMPALQKWLDLDET